MTFHNERIHSRPQFGNALVFILAILVCLSVPLGYFAVGHPSLLFTSLTPSEECAQGREKVLQAIKNYEKNKTLTPLVGGPKEVYRHLVQEGFLATMPTCPKDGELMLDQKWTIGNPNPEFRLNCSSHGELSDRNLSR